MYPFSTEEKLRIKFRKSIRKGVARNAKLDPAVPGCVTALAEPGECFIVKVTRSSSGHYWFSDQRVLLEQAGALNLIVEYGRVQRANLMRQDIVTAFRIYGTKFMLHAHFDRIELELKGGELVVLDELGQAYWPALHFFWWIT